MDLATLALHFERLEATTKRLEMTAILVDVLDACDASDVEAVVRLVQGKVRPDWEGVELGLAEKMILRALVQAGGLNSKDAASIQHVTSVYHDAGDLGLAAERVLGEGAKSKQTGLMAFGADDSEALAVQGAYQRLLDLAKTTGADSQARKQTLLESLLRDAAPLEARYLVRTIAGRLRLGVADQSFLDALAAWHEGKGVRSVTEMEPEERAQIEATRATLEAAFDRCSDLARVAAALAQQGMEGVRAIHVEHGVPLRPMAAERAKTFAEILERHEGRSVLEYKYDGLRIQAHVHRDPSIPVRLFSRRMEDLTDQFPDIQAMLRGALAEGGPESVVVEGEAVPMDLATGRMRPFQDISRRRGRKTGLGEDARRESALAEGAAAGRTVMDDVPVAMFLFDCLAVDGAPVFDDAFLARRERLSRAFSLDERVRLSVLETCEDEAQMEAFFQQAVEDGAEGVMCKDPNAVYKAGNRGFAWIKYKTDYTEALVDTMDLAVIGAFRGRGRRAGWYGALLMAAYDADRGRWTSLCKLGTGFDDATLEAMTDQFAPYLSAEKPAEVDSDMVPDVWFRPHVVMEVQAAELTLSPIHRTAWGLLRDGAGLAARFPRFSGRWRDDKAPEQATTTDELVGMFEAQSKKSA